MTDNTDTQSDAERARRWLDKPSVEDWDADLAAEFAAVRAEERERLTVYETEQELSRRIAALEADQSACIEFVAKFAAAYDAMHGPGRFAYDFPQASRWSHDDKDSTAALDAMLERAVREGYNAACADELGNGMSRPSLAAIVKRAKEGA